MLVTLNIILSADADIGRGLRIRIKTLRMRILLCSSAQGSIYMCTPRKDQMESAEIRMCVPRFQSCGLYDYSASDSMSLN
jgi:hypothetical protein